MNPIATAAATVAPACLSSDRASGKYACVQQLLLFPLLLPSFKHGNEVRQVEGRKEGGKSSSFPGRLLSCLVGWLALLFFFYFLLRAARERLKMASLLAQKFPASKRATRSKVLLLLVLRSSIYMLLLYVLT